MPKCCRGPRGIRGFTGPTGSTGSSPDLTFLSLNTPNTASIAPNDPILWEVIVEDDLNIYNALTGNATVPMDGLWQINVRVAINQNTMVGFPASFYQHILIIHKSLPFPDGFIDRFIGAYQEEFTIVTPAKQVFLQGNETIRLVAGDEVQIRVATVVFAPVFGLPNTIISGTVCLNCFTMTRIGA